MKTLTCATVLSAIALPSSAQVREWSIESAPFVSIGRIDGDERYTLSNISGVLVLRDGRIAIAERTSARIRIYSREGRYVADWGRKGEGPGEYQYVRTITHYRGDSLAVHDMALGRISILDSSGRFGRSTNIRLGFSRVPGTIPSQSCCIFVGGLADGSFVAATPEAIPVHPGPPRYSMQAFYRISADGNRIDSIGAWPGRMSSYDASAPNKVRSVHFGTYPSYLIANERLYLGNGAAYQIQRVRFTADRAIADGSIQGSRPLRPVTKAMRDEREAAVRRSYRDNPQMYEGPVESYLRGEYAETLPAFSRILADPAGNIWTVVPEYGQDRTDPYWVDVFNRSGTQIARLRVRHGLEVVAVTNEAVVAVEHDDLGVEYVKLYRLRKQ